MTIKRNRDEKINKEHPHAKSNKAWAEKECEQIDPYRRITIDSGYDPSYHDILRVTAWNDTAEVAIKRGNCTSRASEAHRVSYNQDSWEFQKQFKEIFLKLKNKLER